MKTERNIDWSFGLVLVSAVLCTLVSGILIIKSYHHFLYPFIDDIDFTRQLVVMAGAPAFLSLIGFCIASLAFIRKEKIKPIIRAVVMIIIGLSIPFSMGSTMLAGFASPFGSMTKNIDNYLVVDPYLRTMDYRIFPERIPESAKEIEYFYRYRHCVDADYDVYVEWKLSKEDFEQEKKRIMTLYPDLTITPNEYDQTFIDYRISYNSGYGGYYFKFVSFSESTLVVRYVFAVTSYDAKGTVRPFFLEKMEREKGTACFVKNASA